MLGEAGSRLPAEAAGGPWPRANPVHLGVSPGPCRWAAGSAGSSYSGGHRLPALLAPLPAHVGRRFQGLWVGRVLEKMKSAFGLERAFCGSLCKRLVRAMLRFCDSHTPKMKKRKKSTTLQLCYQSQRKKGKASHHVPSPQVSAGVLGPGLFPSPCAGRSCTPLFVTIF